MLILLNNPRNITDLSAKAGPKNVPASPARPVDTVKLSSLEERMQQRSQDRELMLKLEKGLTFMMNTAVAAGPATLLSFASEGIARTGAPYVTCGVIAASLAAAAHQLLAKDRDPLELSPATAAVAGAGAIATAATFSPTLAAGLGGVMALAYGAAYLSHRRSS